MPQPGSSPSTTPKVCSQVEVEVRYAETDQMGIVHHANYLVWLELARTRLCAEHATPYPEIEAQGYYLVVTSAQLRYVAPAHYGECITIRCWVERLQSRLVTFGYEVRRSEERLAEATTEHCWVDIASGRPRRAPAELQAAFRRLTAAQDRS